MPDRRSEVGEKAIITKPNPWSRLTRRPSFEGEQDLLAALCECDGPLRRDPAVLYLNTKTHVDRGDGCHIPTWSPVFTNADLDRAEPTGKAHPEVGARRLTAADVT